MHTIRRIVVFCVTILCVCFALQETRAEEVAQSLVAATQRLESVVLPAVPQGTRIADYLDDLGRRLAIKVAVEDHHVRTPDGPRLRLSESHLPAVIEAEPASRQLARIAATIRGLRWQMQSNVLWVSSFDDSKRSVLDSPIDKVSFKGSACDFVVSLHQYDSRIADSYFFSSETRHANWTFAMDIALEHTDVRGALSACLAQSPDNGFVFRIACAVPSQVLTNACYVGMTNEICTLQFLPTRRMP